MPRSLKKGPFVDDHLLKKVDAQNEKNTTARSSRPGRGGVTIIPDFTAGTPSRCTTGRKHVPGVRDRGRWSGTSSVSSRRLGRSKGHIKDGTGKLPRGTP